MPWLLLATLLAASPILPHGAPAPVVHHLTVPVGVWDAVAEDVNGDGVLDLFALCCDDRKRPLEKCLAVFLSQPGGGYTQTPSSILRLGPEVGCAFFAEVDGTAPREWIALDATGAAVYGFDGNGFVLRQCPRFASLLPSGAREPVFLKHAVVNVDGDAVEEWLIPVPMGFELRRADRTLATVPCDVPGEIRGAAALTVSTRIPAARVFDATAGGEKGLAFLSDRFADFAWGPRWEQRAQFTVPVNLEEKWEASTQMADFDNNGLPDLLVTQTRGTLNVEVLTQVYMASGVGTYPAQPSASFQARGALATPLIKDFDGDGHSDILFVKVPFGITSITNFFLRRKLSVEVNAYRFNGTGFAQEPDLVESLTLEAPEGREQVAYSMGDFTGDGRADVAFGVGAGKLVVHRGSKERFFEPKPFTTIDVNAFGLAQTYRIQSDPRDDLLIIHPGTQRRCEMDVVLF